MTTASIPNSIKKSVKSRLRKRRFTSSLNIKHRKDCDFMFQIKSRQTTRVTLTFGTSHVHALGPTTK